MMSLSFKLISASLLIGGSLANAVPFSGDVTADFASSVYAEELDPLDVGVASNAPMGTVSGWDLHRSLFVFDQDTDRLSVGLEFFGIAGDADGDGGEGTTSPWLALNYGIDMPGLALTESICMAFDFDQDGAYDLIVGNSALDGLHRVSTFTGSPSMPAFAFGPVLPAHMGAWYYSPSASTPDYEFELEGISQLDTIEFGTICFDYIFFAGSYSDDGVGEDYQFGTLCLTDDELVDAREPVSMDLLQAHPNPFNPTTTLSVELAQTGAVDLRVFDLAGRQVATLAQGRMEAGRHEVAFNAANLPSGLYLARLQTEQGQQVSRLILTK